MTLQDWGVFAVCWIAYWFSERAFVAWVNQGASEIQPLSEN